MDPSGGSKSEPLLNASVNIGGVGVDTDGSLKAGPASFAREENGDGSVSVSIPIGGPFTVDPTVSGHLVNSRDTHDNYNPTVFTGNVKAALNVEIPIPNAPPQLEVSAKIIETPKKDITITEEDLNIVPGLGDFIHKLKTAGEDRVIKGMKE
jgi:hypothetical protein